MEEAPEEHVTSDPSSRVTEVGGFYRTEDEVDQQNIFRKTPVREEAVLM